MLNVPRHLTDKEKNKEVKNMNLNELNATARELLKLRAMIEKLNAQADALTDKIKAAMVDAGQETMTGDGWKASWKNVNSNRFDSKRFKAEQADLYQQYRNATAATRLILKSA